MIKELFLAIILGALLGFGVTGGYFAVNKSKASSSTAAQASSEISTTPSIGVNSPDNSPSPTIAVSTTQNENPDLIINSPDDDIVVGNSKLTIKGTTFPNSTVVITSASNNVVITADENGIFSAPIELDSGLNLIKISAIGQNDNQTDTNLNITYSTAKI